MFISLMSRQFIHRKANCMNSIPCSSRWEARGAEGRRKEARRGVNIQSASEDLTNMRIPAG